VADYAAALLPALRKHGDVIVNSAGGAVDLYHLGNNGLHHGIYSLALDRPGVVVLHDAVLHHMLLGSLDEAATRPSSFTTTGSGIEVWRRNCGETGSAPVRTRGTFGTQCCGESPRFRER